MLNNKEKHNLFCEVFGTDRGKLALKELMQLCRYDKTSMHYISGELSEQTTFFNEGKRSVYIQLRQHLSKNILKGVENGE